MSGRRPAGDEGTVMLLVLGFAVVLLGLVGVVSATSVVLLGQRGVASAADGAAVAAAQQLQDSVYYEKGLGERLPLDPLLVAQVVEQYERAVTPATSLTGGVQPDGFTVEVQAQRVVAIPFGGYVGKRSVTVRSVARARSPVAP